MRVRDYTVIGILPDGDPAFETLAIPAHLPAYAQDSKIAEVWERFRSAYPKARSPHGGWGIAYDTPSGGYTSD